MSGPAFIAFPGQGSQHIKMLSRGYILDLASSAEFKPLIQLCDDLVCQSTINLIENGPEDILNQTSITQPLLLLTSFLHFHQLQQFYSFKILGMAGHSLGEYSALVASNAISIEDALKIVRLRGMLMERAETGSMAAIIGLSPSQVVDACAEASYGPSSIAQAANLNSPMQTVISGHLDAVERAQNICKSMGAKRAIKLNVSIASHSALMESVCSDFEECLRGLSISTPEIPIFHNVTADLAISEIEIKDLLVKQLYLPVRWLDICKKVNVMGIPMFECGPGKVLSGLCKANSITDYNYVTNPTFPEVL